MSKTHTVAQGETLADIARLYGFSDAQTIYEHEKNFKYNHDKNEARRLTHPDPNEIEPGATLFIPDVNPARMRCITDRKHTFIRQPLAELPLYFSVQCVDEEDHVYSACRYELTVEGEFYEGVTGPKGELAVRIPRKAKLAKLRLFPLTDAGGDLDPIDWEIDLKRAKSELGDDAGKKDGELLIDLDEAEGQQ